MSLYAALAGALLWLASLGGAFLYGKHVETAEQALIEKTSAGAARVAADAAADAIARIEVQRVEITQPIVREVRTNTVYADCRHTAGGLRGVNAALTGRAEPLGARELPASAAAR